MHAGYFNMMPAHITSGPPPFCDSRPPHTRRSLTINGYIDGFSTHASLGKLGREKFNLLRNVTNEKKQKRNKKEKNW